MKVGLPIAFIFFSLVVKAQWTGQTSSTDLTTPISRSGSVAITGTGSYLTLTSRVGGGSYGTILFQNGTDQNLILAETAANNWTLGYGLAGATPTSVISWNSSKNTTFAGNVGIGTAPSSKLDVRGGTTRLINYGTGYNFISGNADPGNDSYFYHLTSSSYHILGSNRNGSGIQRKLGFALGGGDTESDIKMTIDNTGNVGIGTNSPSSRLFVSNGNTYFKLLQESVGIGDMMVLGGQQGTSLSVNAYGSVQQQLVTNIGVNYAISSADGASQFTVKGTKKSPMIQLNAEDGSISMFGENGNGADWRTPSFNRGLTVASNGFAGFGTNTPNSQLHVASDNNHAINISRANGTYGFRIFRNALEGSVYFQIGNTANTWETKIKIGEGEGSNTKLLLNPDGGNVGIGNTNPDAKLAVSGQVHAQEVKVSVAVPGPDYVFEKEYKLASLEEIKNYIDQNKHLPEVPSAKEMEKDGVQLGEMNMLLLKKIEELTLYVIEQNKNNAEHRKQIQSLQAEIEKLKKSK